MDNDGRQEEARSQRQNLPDQAPPDVLQKAQRPRLFHGHIPAGAAGSIGDRGKRIHSKIRIPQSAMATNGFGFILC